MKKFRAWLAQKIYKSYVRISDDSIEVVGTTLILDTNKIVLPGRKTK